MHGLSVRRAECLRRDRSRRIKDLVDAVVMRAIQPLSRSRRRRRRIRRRGLRRRGSRDTSFRHGGYDLRGGLSWDRGLGAGLHGGSRRRRRHDGAAGCWWWRRCGAGVTAANDLVLAGCAALVVDGQGAAVAAEFLVVARALHVAFAHDAVLGRVRRLERVVAVALAAVLETRVREAGCGAEVDALLHRHVVAARVLAREGARARVVAAADVLPLLRRSQVDVVSDRGADDGGVSAVSGWGGASWTRSHGVAAWQLVEGAVDVLVDDLRELARLGLVASEHGDGAAFGYAAAVGGARVDGFLEDLDVPAVHKVAVEPVARGVALSEDEGVLVAVPLVVELVDAVQHLEEDGDQVHGELRGAGARVVVLARGVRDVAFVVGAVEVFSVPT